MDKKRETRITNNDDRSSLERMIFRQTFAPLFARGRACSLECGLMTTEINYHRDCTIHVVIQCPCNKSHAETDCAISKLPIGIYCH